MLIAIVLVSVMNVMLMAVYERIREIGTLAAIGTPPRKHAGMFLGEGLLLGLVGAVVGIGSAWVVALLKSSRWSSISVASSIMLHRP